MHNILEMLLQFFYSAQNLTVTVGNIAFDIPKEVSKENLLVYGSWCCFALVGPPGTLLFQVTLSGTALNAGQLRLCPMLSRIKKFGI